MIPMRTKRLVAVLPVALLLAGGYARSVQARLPDEAGGGLAPAVGIAPPPSPARRSFEVANVRDFGAVGDGKVDDTRAVKSAYEVVRAAGGTVYFPPGRYRFNLLVS